jgi:hypothetical protein
MHQQGIHRRDLTLKIVDVRVRRFKFPPAKALSEPFFNSILFNQPSKQRWASITQITTDEGIAGFWPRGNKDVVENPLDRSS